MPKETFKDVTTSHDLTVKWGVWGTVELGVEARKEFPYPFAKEGEPTEMIKGWWLSLSKKDMKRLIKSLKRAYKQYDMETYRDGI
jgi:hypothetical protein